MYTVCVDAVPIDALPEFSRDGQHIWTARVPLLYFFAVEWHYPDRVCRQFGGYQEIPASVEYDHQLHKYDGRQRSEQWDIFHYEFVQMWEQRNERVEALRHISIDRDIAEESVEKAMILPMSMHNAPFSHEIHQWYNEGDPSGTQTSQVDNPTQNNTAINFQYHRRYPGRNRRRPPCGN
nr:serine/threonine-protein phosphatase 7 long form homolog [Ipomoea batatas]